MTKLENTDVANAISQIKPQALWTLFQQICAIPHPSGHEQELRNFFIAKAKKTGLQVTVDSIGNLRIDKSTSPGHESGLHVLLQAHLDMVPQKNHGKDFNFITDAIVPGITGNRVVADHTTLGADNGIGLAAAMAVLLDTGIEHGPLSVLFTVEEETGLRGAANLNEAMLDGDILINLDSEDENMVFTGCAGGARCEHLLSPTYHFISGENYCSYSINISGLRGGHSGCNIHEGRGNSIKLLSELLDLLVTQYGAELIAINGGNLDNAIPREAHAVICIEKTVNFDIINSAIDQFAKDKRNILGDIEPKMKINIERCSLLVDQVFSSEFKRRLLAILLRCPHGVISMSKEFPGIVETSSNLAAIITSKENIIIRTSQRSMSNILRSKITDEIGKLFTEYNAFTSVSNEYSGWTPELDSNVLRIFCEVHQRVAGKLPLVTAIHAGLECGIIKNINPRLDIISFGPEIRNAHSPDEYVSIPSVERFWLLLLELLRSL